MRCIFFAVLLFVSAPFVTEVSAQGAGEGVLVVRMQRVIDESLIGKGIRKDLEGEVRSLKSKIEALQKKVLEQRKQLESQKAVLSESALREKMEAVAKGERAAAREAQDAQEQLAKSRDKKLKDIVAKIDVIVEELAKDRGVKVVLEYDRRSVVYASNRLDITSEVIEKLNKEHIGL